MCASIKVSRLGLSSQPLIFVGKGTIMIISWNSLANEVEKIFFFLSYCLCCFISMASRSVYSFCHSKFISLAQQRIQYCFYIIKIPTTEQNHTERDLVMAPQHRVDFSINQGHVYLSKFISIKLEILSPLLYFMNMCTMCKSCFLSFLSMQT